jgi:glycosyltransferase 2 family protein
VGHKKSKLPRLSPTTQLLLAILLFAASVLASRDAEIARWEIDLFNLIYGLPDWLKPIFLVITQFGSIIALGFFAVFYLLKKHHHIVIRLLMTGSLAYLAAGVAKDLFGRVRPFEFLPDVVSLEYIVRGAGFPSGHTALATALALTLGHYLPRKYRWVVIFVIVGVGLSRLYLGIHFPLDIIGGFAIGWASYALFRHVRLYDTAYKRKKKSA